MTKNVKQFRNILIVLFSVMPLEAFAQTVITLAPEIVGGVGFSTSTPITFSTQSISVLVGAEGSIRGFTGDSNLALNLGIGYDSRGFDGNGYMPQSLHTDPNIIRENYIDMDASFRYKCFQFGTVIGFPLNWHLTRPNTYPSSMEWYFSNADMNTTVGIFFAGKFTVSEWTSGKLIFIAQLDFESFVTPLPNSPLNSGVRLTYNNAPNGYLYLPDLGPIFLARVGLSYEFSVWNGK